MSDIWMGAGIIHRGVAAEIISELYEALLNCNPIWAYRLNGMAVETDTVDNDGSGPFNGQMILLADDTPDTITGPDGLVYPELGRGEYGDAGNCYTVADTDFDAYANGLTVVTVYMPLPESPGSDKADPGFIWMRRESPSVEASEYTMLLSLSRYTGTTTTTTGSVANQTFKNFAAGVMYAVGQWKILEQYFPPGDTQPVLYEDGVLLTGSDVTNVNSGTRFDRGTLQPIFLGSNDDPDPGDSFDANGFYAIHVGFDGELDSTCRDEYLFAAYSEGWLQDPGGTEVIFLDATDAGGEQTFFPYNNVLLKVQGEMSFFGGGFNGDPDTTYGSLPTGHGGIFQVKIAGVWTHIEPIAGPFSSPNSNHTYWFEYDAGGSQFEMRVGDSAHGDNTGGFTVTVYNVL